MNKSEYSTFGHLLFYFRTLVILLSSTPQRFPTNLSILRPPLSHRIVSTYTSSCQNGIAAIRPLSGYGHKRCLQDGFHGIRNDDFKPATAATKESAGQHSPVVRRTLFFAFLFLKLRLTRSLPRRAGWSCSLSLSRWWSRCAGVRRSQAAGYRRHRAL